MYSLAWAYFTIPFDYSCIGRLIHHLERQKEKLVIQVLLKHHLRFKRSWNHCYNQHNHLSQRIWHQADILSFIMRWRIPIWPQHVLYNDILHSNEEGFIIQVLGRSIRTQSQHHRLSGLLRKLQGLPNALESFPEPKGVQCSLLRWTRSPEDNTVYKHSLFTYSVASSSSGSYLWNCLY